MEKTVFEDISPVDYVTISSNEPVYQISELAQPS